MLRSNAQHFAKIFLGLPESRAQSMRIAAQIAQLVLVGKSPNCLSQQVDGNDCEALPDQIAANMLPACRSRTRLRGEFRDERDLRGFATVTLRSRDEVVHQFIHWFHNQNLPNPVFQKGARSMKNAGAEAIRNLNATMEYCARFSCG
ncbi:MAG TPA: hypothetical protein VFN13_03975, partial [Rudaea sp.]|nr:hypothetical protein [Rudaea sp.]